MKWALLFILTVIARCVASKLSPLDSLELSRYVQHKFSPPGLIMNHLAVDNELGFVYVAAQNRLYQLNNNLEHVIANVSTALTKKDLCSFNNNQLCEPTLINNTNKLLLIDSQSDRLIVCGTVFRGTCKTRRLKNIKEVLYEISKKKSELSEADYVACNKKDCSTVGLITQGPTVNNDVLYVATTITDGDDIWRPENSISTHSLNVDPSQENVLFGYAVDVAHNKAKTSVLVVSQNRKDFRNYKYMFETGGDDGFVYFLFSRTGKDNNYRSIIARICKSDPIFNSYVELPVYCVNNYSMNFILGAHYSPHDPNNLNSNGTLYILFNTTAGSAVCSFEKSYLDFLFYETMEICYKQRGLNGTQQVVNVIGVSSNECDNNGHPYLRDSVSLDSMVTDSEKLTLSYYNGSYEASAYQIYCGAFYLPVKMTRLSYTQAHSLYQASHKFTSITTNKVQDVVVAFVGTQSGLILKINLNTGELYGSIPVGQSILTDMIWDQQPGLAVPQLYVTAINEVLLIKVAACSKHVTCNTCIQSNDPYCGWCILENRCSTKNECNTADKDRTRWMGQNTKQCIYAKSPDPRERTLNADIVTMVYGLPVLATGEQYQCVFGNNHTKQATTRRNENFTEVSCKAPASKDIPLSFPGQDSVNVSLSVRYNQHVDVVSTTATFYDCNLYGQSLQKDNACAGCLSSKWPCRWCISDHTCLPQEKQESDQCKTDLSVCPTILSVAKPDTLLSVGQENGIQLSARNLPHHGTYRCMIQIQDEPDSITVQAELLNSTILCSPHSYDYASEKATASANVTVFWKLDFIVDNMQQNPITFYKCSVDHSDCSLCSTAAPKYNCGWCDNTQECSIQQSCSPRSLMQINVNWITNANQCEPPQITGFEPFSGPLNGGTEIHISGVNMGTVASDVQRVTVAGKTCDLLNYKYTTSVSIVCISKEVQVEGDENEVAGKIMVEVRNHTIYSSDDFIYRNPTIIGLAKGSDVGPQAGGTIIKILGKHLYTGTTHYVYIGNGLPCEIRSVKSDQIKCETSRSPSVESNQNVSLRFDNFSVVIPNAFNYTENPQVKEFYTLSGPHLASFLAGGRNISFIGTTFTSVKSPELIAFGMETTPPFRKKRSFVQMLQDSLRLKNYRKKKSLDNFLPSFTSSEYKSLCSVVNSTFMICPSPLITTNQGKNSSQNISNSLYLPASLKLKMDALFIPLNDAGQIKYYPNPQVIPLKKDEDLRRRQKELLTIRVLNLNKEVITKEEVIVMVGKLQCLVQSIDENILCLLPEAEKGETYDVTVTIGNNKWNIGEVTYDLDPATLTEIHIIMIVVGCCVFVCVVFAVVFICFRKKKKKYKANKNDFQKAMESMEMSVRADFRKAFAELSIDMSDLTSDVGDYGIPCLNYRTFVTNFFFPSYRYHPCMKAPESSKRPPGNLEQGLSQFLLLLSNHNFLSVFIHTLEEQKSFSNRDKGSVASLLTVALHQKLDYFTEITKSLISDLISVNVQRNPKLILRRSDSVAEKMLSNWMYICLYPYLREKAGSPIYLLLKAIKQQVSKGPLDAITGKARYTLNDDRLLKEDVESETLTLFIAPTNQSDDEPVIVKVLSCDSVAQVKEKVMDAVYKRVPFSQRPRGDQLDIEWRHGISGHLVLPNMDYTAEPGGTRWRRLMTISDYKVANNATLALIPKQQEQDENNVSEISNHSTDASALSPMLPEENQMKMYHLVKYSDDIEGKRESTINRDRHKHIPEIYLLRLINMKGILQNYVDGVIQSILDKTVVPCPVKHFFHFLDEIAAKHDIVDPEVLHVWKTNSLLGRFWVTILKNPESVFDIEKPDTIASSMAVISQTFIDACNISEHKPTKDSPINKQLYAKEIPNYKRMVAEYYKIIKEQPSVSDQDVNAYIAEINRKHGCEFDVNVALKELWGFVNKYYEEINESLENDTNITVNVIQKLQQIYSLIDSVGNGM